MAPARVQDTGIQTTVTSATDSASLGTVTAGNLLVLALSYFDDPGPPVITSIADGLGNTFTLAVASAGFFGSNRSKVALYYKENCVGGSSTITITYATSTQYDAWAACEFSGVARQGSLDQTASATGNTAGVDANVTSGTTVQADELVVAAACCGRAGDTDVAWGSAATTGYTNIAKYADWANINTLSFDYKVVSAVGTQSANWSHDNVGVSNDSWGAVIATFKAPNYARLERSSRGTLRGTPGRIAA